MKKKRLIAWMKKYFTTIFILILGVIIGIMSNNGSNESYEALQRLSSHSEVCISGDDAFVTIDLLDLDAESLYDLSILAKDYKIYIGDYE